MNIFERVNKETPTRIAIVNHDKCKPNKCGKECMKKCPINQKGKECIDIEDIGIGIKKKIAKIAEQMCIGCGMCVKACPFNAIQIVKLPTGVKKDII